MKRPSPRHRPLAVAVAVAVAGSRRRVAIASAALLVWLPVMAGCNRAAGPDTADPGKAVANASREAAAAAAARPDPNVVAATADLGQLVVARTVEPTPWRETVRVAASVQVDEQRVARIGSAVTGRVTAVAAQVGDAVRVGQPLATVASTDLSTQQMNYLQALAQQQFHQRAVERAQLLVASDVIAPADLQRRQADLVSSEAAVKAGRDFLRSLGMSEAALARLTESRDIASSVTLASTRRGTVIERTVAQGQVIQPSDPAFVVADLSSVWVVADVPEMLVMELRVGEAVEVEIPALGDRRIGGRLAQVAAIVNPETHTLRVRMNVGNAEGLLRPNMLASMLIRGPETRPLAVPRSAVVREADQDHVFVRLPDGRWRMTRVQLGPESDGVRPVLDGLAGGERIAAQGAFHLNAARKTAAGG